MDLISVPVAAAVGAAVGAVALGTTAAVHGDLPGLAIALGHIPSGTHGYDVVYTVKATLLGGASGGGIGAAIAGVAMAVGAKAAAVVR